MGTNPFTLVATCARSGVRFPRNAVVFLMRWRLAEVAVFLVFYESAQTSQRCGSDCDDEVALGTRVVAPS
jgi:hypothetical protein